MKRTESDISVDSAHFVGIVLDERYTAGLLDRIAPTLLWILFNLIGLSYLMSPESKDIYNGIFKYFKLFNIDSDNEEVSMQVVKVIAICLMFWEYCNKCPITMRLCGMKYIRRSNGCDNVTSIEVLQCNIASVVIGLLYLVTFMSAKSPIHESFLDLCMVPDYYNKADLDEYFKPVAPQRQDSSTISRSYTAEEIAINNHIAALLRSEKEDRENQWRQHVRNLQLEAEKQARSDIIAEEMLKAKLRAQILRPVYNTANDASIRPGKSVTIVELRQGAFDNVPHEVSPSLSPHSSRSGSDTHVNSHSSSTSNSSLNPLSQFTRSTSTQRPIHRTVSADVWKSRRARYLINQGEEPAVSRRTISDDDDGGAQLM